MKLTLQELLNQREELKNKILALQSERKHINNLISNRKYKERNKKVI